MLNTDIFSFKNSVDPDQQASEKPADQDPHCFPFCLQIHANNWNFASHFDKVWHLVKHFNMVRVK